MNENQNGSFELTHYGILGMKWGVRRTPEQLGHHKIKKGTKVYRSTPDPNEEESGHAYVTYLPPDRDLYRGYFSQGLKDYRGLGENSKLYESSYTLTEDLNIPSRKELQDVVINVMKEEKARRDIGEAFANRLLREADYFYDAESKVAKKWYDENGEFNRDAFIKDYRKAQQKEVDNFIKRIGDRPVEYQFNVATGNFGKSSWVKKQVISELQKRGYNAMVDEASVGGRGGVREGVDPIIVFDRSKSMSKDSSREISKKETKKATQRYMNWRLVANNPRNKSNPW